MRTYVQYTSLIAKPGHRDKLMEVLIEAADSMKRLRDCYNYNVTASLETPNLLFVYMEWRNQRAYQASLSLGIVKKLKKRVRPLISGFVRTNVQMNIKRHSLIATS